MSDALVLVLDAGTGGGRAAIYDAEGERVAAAERRWRPGTVPELAPFAREYDPHALADAIDEATLEALAGVDPERVEAIACTGQRIACAFLDQEGRTLYAGPNDDVRAFLGMGLDDLEADDLYATTGRFPPFLYAPARLRWFAREAPEVFARIDRVVGLPGWVAHRLTGACAMDATVAADLLHLDVEARTALALEPDRGIWPRLAEPTAPLGELSTKAATRLHLRPGIPVAVGLADTQAATLLGGEDTLVAGSSAPLMRRMDTPRRDPKERLWLDPDVRPGAWLLEANLGEMGSAHEWLAELLALPTFDAFDALARTAPAGARAARPRTSGRGRWTCAR